ncbi:hypothetical protein AKJ09_00693 [Labilithrix luteola]|uniref:Uncharacterized protein n=1 Tax=Labilithrix luteola TaxID=1391654 RepID=A0A0K1PLN9_9BACT|nr:hypothetical protein [Labilithrix luteola]AKU94029.1 hypothetical protein AKJ09_00693 [Labilithrix luteola]
MALFDSFHRACGALVLLPAILAACVIVDDDHDRHRHYDRDDRDRPSEPDTTSPAPSPAPSGTTSPSSAMLVEVDTDQVMNADPGQGVGVFIEYATGGKWHLWWTCDTARTGQDCDFDVLASVESGAITNVDATNLTGGSASTANPNQVEARIRTTNEVHGISFTTNPGEVLTVQASVSGISDGSFLFFVQDGQVNGGFPGVLTNPLKLKGKTP